MATEIYRPVPGFRPSTPAVTAKTIDNVLAEHPAVVIHFWAEWSGVDPPMDRCVQEVLPQFQGRVHFVSCDVDVPDNIDLCERCTVANVPFLAVFVDGQPRGGIMGLRTTNELASELGKLLSDSYAKKKWWRFWRRS